MSDTNERLRVFRRWAAERDGAFSRANALEHGVGDGLIRRGLADGEWRRYEGVYLLGGISESDRTRLRAAILHAGPRARATATSALDLYGFDLSVGLGAAALGAGKPYIWIPGDRHPYRDGAVYLRDQVAEANTTFVRHCPAVTAQRAVIDALRVLDVDDAREVLYRALDRRLVTTDSLERAISQLSGTRGLRQLRDMHAVALGGSRSAAELLLHKMLGKARIRGWTANARVYDAAGLIGIVDVLFDKQRLVIEVDGRAWHKTDAQFERDHEREVRLVNAGYTVLRFTWEQLQNPAKIIAAIRMELAR